MNKKELEDVIESKLCKYQRELVNYQSVIAQLLKHATNQNQSIVRLLQELNHKKSKEELWEQ